LIHPERLPNFTGRENEVAMAAGETSLQGPLGDAAAFGTACRESRLALGLKLKDAALAAGVNVRFASELENGKASAQLGLALRYAATLGIEILYRPPVEPTSSAPGRRRARSRP
jgi:DNA-binding XRE family transcriptional regulator